jgi:ABC-type transporter Mla subunit MlaD
MSPFRAGLIALIVMSVASYVGVTRLNPFASPYELEAVFSTVNNLQLRSPVRIAGVDVGKVTAVEALDGGGARVEMEIQDKGLPIHEDATLKIRPRVFLEGNFFVDLEPGSPSAPILQEDGGPIPTTQTAAPVQFGQLLAALQSDTRADLQTFLGEYSKGLEGAGARGFNRSIRYWEDAYRDAALANDATLGEEPTKDIQRVLRGQQRTLAALVEDERALKDLVTNFDVTAAAFAQQDVALEASVPALRDTLRVGRPALGALNSALPSLRAFARDALPGAKSSGPTLEASLPFITQARELVAPDELGGLAADLRLQIPRLVRLVQRSVPLLDQNRALAACSNAVLNPFFQLRIPDPDFPENSNQRVIEQAQHGFVGLAGESRTHDSNTPFYREQAVSPLALTKVRPAAPPDGGATPPPHRPDVPCESQEPPNLNSPGGLGAEFASSGRRGRRISLHELTRAFEAEKVRLARLWAKQRRLDAREETGK